MKESYMQKSSRLQIPAFKGRNDPEAFFGWERKVDSIFSNFILSEEKKVRLSTELGRSRRRYRKSLICSWEKMKKIMRSQFVPSSYHMKNRVVPSSCHNDFFRKFCKLQQDKVQRYHYANMEDSVKLAIDMEHMQQFIAIWESKRAKFEDQTKGKVFDIKKDITY
ncbi:hypothetical protein Ahy_B08g090401 [Arachis hypogaea]|uniref:Retrotransposon gag domain-containing protein n=1 Tax=Arachis hypogaea TaxID=3818 RepID=A0A444Y038_ARAHY|nr:hypothetical protein Ahy_B08g090401 [Arachis hypogaea]